MPRNWKNDIQIIIMFEINFANSFNYCETKELFVLQSAVSMKRLKINFEK